MHSCSMVGNAHGAHVIGWVSGLGLGLARVRVRGRIRIAVRVRIS